MGHREPRATLALLRQVSGLRRSSPSKVPYAVTSQTARALRHTHLFTYRSRLQNRIENLRKSVATIERALGPHKKMDLFEPARVDRSISIEQVMENLVVLRNEGHFANIGLSECSAETLRRAHAVGLCRSRA
jgi:aryl-alcohol dehydrogenase-like predicted oxidoreductase